MLTLDPVALAAMTLEEIRVAKMSLLNALELMDQLQEKHLTESEYVQPPCSLFLTRIGGGPENLLEAIKALRGIIPGLDLKMAKDIVDGIRHNGSFSYQLQPWLGSVPRALLHGLKAHNIGFSVQR